MNEWIREHWVIVLVLGLVGTIAIAAVLGTFVLGLGNQVSSSASAPDGGGAAETGGGSGPSSYYGTDGRVIVRESSMRVRVEEYDPAFQRSREIARAHGGFVASWDRSSERQWDGGTVVIKVPAENFTATRDRLSEIGRVESENVRMEDFTAEYADREERIETLREDERMLEGMYRNASTTEQRLRIRDELEEVRDERRRLERGQDRLERREALSTIRLRIHEPESRRPAANYDSAFGFVDAFLGAVYGGLSVVKGVIVVIGYAIPAGIAAIILGTFGFACYRVWWRLKEWIDDRLLPDSGEE